MVFPYDFILEELYPLQLRHKKMFGVDSFYYGEKIVFALRKQDNYPNDNGIWIATKIKFHKELKLLIRDLKAIEVYGLKTWLVLPESSDHFEEGIIKIAELIKQHSSLIGNIPKVKKKK
ncbi:hypothetical protein [Aquimarina sp. 2201CG5-10]|uniref:hypothetical protein n=1 Tax=Aquimarina callyspongiae TaxID=3098150 RepID=UPI002AB477D6|nr:hypothetical protein [Aquimarina sp. 2201CG5-10]MDY8136225.1 hypothetical protein [Aquimarina sp. 2201CG5-10]